MHFDIVTIFPDFFAGPFRYGVVGKAIESGLVKVNVHNLRDWTHDRHKTVDDRPFGGGEGMVMKPEPLFDAVEAVRQPGQRVVLLSAQGRPFNQAMARRMAAEPGLVMICGRYEGIDERVAQHLADEEVSVGDFVLSGGELAAAIMVDAISRLLPGVVGNEASTVHESFSGEGGAKMLDTPHWTRPAEFRGWKVPEVLLNGNHAEIGKWRRQAALEKTCRMRPDLIESGTLERET
ncbi:MAG: tRNA (guanosine(37)-N1)-methyltransferase TrmD [Acidobacteria bacterium]|nr:tRNA (guanosine(37)-N1)-methyltransferase TrmD [Acidobacteriota bacterium]